jgi:polysaccharide export outer membrane protein
MAQAPGRPSDDADFQASAAPVRPGIDDEDDADPVTPGDVITVRYEGNKDLESVTVSVDAHGDLHLPLLGDVHVGGSPLPVAEGAVQASLSHFDYFSRAALTISETRGRYVTVSGAVEKPGNVPLVGLTRLADVLASVGGLRQATSNDRMVELGDVNGVRVVRHGQPLAIDASLALQGAPRHNVRMRPGDVVVVPPALEGRIVVLGHVNKPTTFPFRSGMRLTEVLADAGGLSDKADSEDVRVLRGGYARPRLFVANMKDVLSGVRPDVTLAPGDVVFVTEHWFASVGDVLERLVPLAAGALVATTLVK